MAQARGSRRAAADGLPAWRVYRRGAAPAPRRRVRVARRSDDTGERPIVVRRRHRPPACRAPPDRLTNPAAAPGDCAKVRSAEPRIRHPGEGRGRSLVKHSARQRGDPSLRWDDDRGRGSRYLQQNRNRKPLHQRTRVALRTRRAPAGDITAIGGSILPIAHDTPATPVGTHCHRRDATGPVRPSS